MVVRRWRCRGDGGSAVEMVMVLWRWQLVVQAAGGWS
ncbi:hypothetical protein Tco_0239851, partial [Tanacetum coccineum]